MARSSSPPAGALGVGTTGSPRGWCTCGGDVVVVVSGDDTEDTGDAFSFFMYEGKVGQGQHRVK